MKMHLYIKLFFLLSVFSVTAPQDTSSRVNRIPNLMLTRRPQQAPMITLIVDHNPVQIREQVRFTLLPENITTQSPFIYNINFGDGSQAVKKNGESYFLHEYRSAGSYNVSVSIEIPGGAEIFVPKPIMAKTITMQVNNVSLFVEPTIVEVGQTVSFETKFNSINKNLRYNFNFGDDSSSGWLTDQNTTHTYSQPGTYFAFADINGLDENSLYPITKTEREQIDVRRPFSVRLTASDSDAKVGDVITFTASSNRKEETIEYWFNFGEDDKVTVSNISSINHTYSEPGSFIAAVRLAINGRPVTDPAALEIKISLNDEIKSTSNDLPWWIYCVAALLIFGGGFLGWKYVKGKSKRRKNIPDFHPTFHPFPDSGSSNVKEPKTFAINYEIHFNPNFANAKHMIKPSEENLIKSKTVKP